MFGIMFVHAQYFQMFGTLQISIILPNEKIYGQIIIITISKENTKHVFIIYNIFIFIYILIILIYNITY